MVIFYNREGNPYFGLPFIDFITNFIATFMKYILFCAVLCSLAFVGCEPKPYYDYEKECWVLKKDNETLYGHGFDYKMFIPPAFDKIEHFKRDMEEDFCLATRKGKTYMYGEFGEILCDSIPLISKPIYLYARGQNGSISGSLAGLPANPISVYTEKGVFLVINKNKWICYGPYENIVTGNSGLMFKQNGKWGVRKYGNWIEKPQPSWTTAKDYYFQYDEIILLPAKYDKIINYAYANGSYDEKRGYLNKNEVKWYALDGTKWYAFDVDGLPIAVNQEELNRALRMRPQIEIGNLQVQRIGYDDASVVRIERRRY